MHDLRAEVEAEAEQSAHEATDGRRLGHLMGSGALFGSDGFQIADLSAGMRYHEAKKVRLVTANVRETFVGLFGVVEELDGSARSEVSLVLQRQRNGSWAVDGNARADARRNGERVAALLHAARDEHDIDGNDTTIQRSAATLHVEVVDARARDSINHWDTRNDSKARLLAGLRVAVIEGQDPDLDEYCRQIGMRQLSGEFPESDVDRRYRSALTFPADDPAGQDQRWAEFLASDRAKLESEGHEVVVDEKFGLNLVQPDDWYSDLEVPGGPGNRAGAEPDDEDSIDWLEFRYGIQIDGQQVSLLPALIEYLRSRPGNFSISDLTTLPKEKTIALHLPGDGDDDAERFVAIPAARLYGALSVLGELLDPDSQMSSDHLRLHRLDAARLANPENQPPIVRRAPDFLYRCAREMRELDDVVTSTVDMPLGLQATLRPYQKDGVGWLQFLREQKLSGILADDMGLGKTMQTLCHLLIEKQSGRADLPCLIVAPKSVVPNWEKEAKKFAPSLSVLMLQGPRRHRYYEVLEHCDLVITSFPTLLRDAEALRHQRFHYIVLDEAHTIKNSRASVTRAAYNLDARHRLCLSGTPIENHLGELWSQFHFLMPGFLGDEDAFSRTYRQPIERDRDEGRRKQLADRVRPVMLRRTKNRVASELPAKTEIIQPVELNPKQVELYEAVRASLAKELREEIAERGFDASRLLILDGLLKLRQICCHPRLLKLASASGVRTSAKLDLLMERLPDMVESGSQILIFSQFTSMLSLIEEALEAVGIKYLLLTGASKDRGHLCDDFQSGKAPVFLISLRAGGTGLNLTAADNVIHFDPWWNPALESQATDRAYRIGQKRPVFVHKFIAQGTIEEKILLLQQKKRALFEGILEGVPQSLNFSEGELDDLLAPIAKG